MQRPVSTSRKSYALNAKQIRILQLLFKFRFMTAKQYAAINNFSNISVANKALGNLYDQSYIGRRYKPGERFLGKSASYYLLPKGIAVLKQHGFTAKQLKSLYNQDRLTDRFIGRCSYLIELYLAVKRQYPEASYFSNTEIAQYDFMPKPIPAAFIQKGGLEYFVEIVDEFDPYFLPGKLLKKYSGLDDARLLILFDNPRSKLRFDKKYPPEVRDFPFEAINVGTVQL